MGQNRRFGMEVEETARDMHPPSTKTIGGHKENNLNVAGADVSQREEGLTLREVTS
jgi:hypothetical protein